MITVGLVLSTVNAPTTVAQDVAGIEDFQTSTLSITGVTEETDGNYNFKSFEVEVPEAGAYYTEFWLLPSKYANNSYSTFIVYLNDDYVGSINPTIGNWQSARVDGHETFNLIEGTNVISIACLAPEFPEVETIRVALNDADAAFSSEAYNMYLEDAVAGVSYDIPEDDELSIYTSDASDVGMEHFSNIPLNYTFYKTFSFTKDQEIFITTSSSASHKIDVIYFGSKPKTILNSSTNAKDSLIVNSGIIQSNAKFRLAYTPATSEEMQGLSWVFPSEKSLNSSTQLATARLTIPKSGQYLVRVRHATSGETSVADINVNGAYYYENAPITLSYKSCVIPADGNYYATFTCCNNFGIDDPFLFIHGGGSDKIVGFNDDAPSEKKQQYDISTWDSYISQNYFMNTSGISVSSYSSSNPTSRCNILACISEREAQSVAKLRAQSANTASVTKMSTIGKTVNVSISTNIRGLVSINASDDIQKVSIYGLSGIFIGSVNCKESDVNIPVSSLNITQPGIYVISVETSNGVTTKKLVIR
jgi:hypothetical protein